ncbi:hypothetical protein V5799_024319 [Amblyomma americanum]|uniref:Uncharacterized protein n=1 Tax=Amblyomma americanum TaxID=6943 RepID=A0AAQ4ECW4_AMBAM
MAAPQEESSADSVALRNFYGRSCVPEVSEPVAAVLQGQLPAWLQGKLLRNGPGMESVGVDRYNHALDSLAQIRQFSIENGQVFYQNRFLRSQSFLRNQKANRIVVSEFGTMAHHDPCSSVFERLSSYFSMDMSDNALVNVMPIGDDVYAMTETPHLFRVDLDTLETLERKSLKNLVAVHIATAHPHLDPGDGATYNIGTKMGARPAFILVRYPPGVEGGASSVDHVTAVGKIPLQSRVAAPYIHSFGLTENLAVVLEQSLHIPSMLKAKFFRHKTYIDALKFYSKKNVRYHVMKKNTEDLHPGVIESTAFFPFHHINAFERGDELVVDLICYDDESFIRDFDLTGKNPVSGKSGYLRRFVLPLYLAPNERVSVKPQCLAKNELCGELPRINQNRNGKAYQFVYCLSNVKGEAHRPCISKLDVSTGNWLRWERKGWFPSEHVFVPRSGAVDEDDGVVLSSLLREDDDKKLALVVIDARTFQQLAVAEFDCPSSMQADFHGWFLQQEV